MVAPKIFQTLIAAALTLSIVLHVSSLRAEDVPYATIGSWEITSTKGNNLVGCYATGRFKDQTLLRMVLLKAGTGKQWFLGIYNPRWRWVSKKSQHVLIIETRGIWHGSFSVENGWLWTAATIPFMNSMAEADWMKVATGNRRWLTALSMKGSTAAIRTVVRCVRRKGPSPEPPQTATLYGTGLFVGPNTILTANHVVSDCRAGTVQVRDLDVDYWFGATIAAQDRNNDLATLDTDRNAPAIASFRLRPAELGEQVATYGFPYSGGLSTKGNFTLGYITSLQGPGDDNRVLQISAQVQPGNSGGPLLDMAGNVVGVVVARMPMQSDLTIPQDVNFAIRSSIALNFLSAARISPNFAPATASNLSSEKLAKEAQKIAVHVLCQGTPTVASTATTSTVATVGGTFSGAMSPSQLGLPLGKIKHQRNRLLPSKVRWQQL